MLLLIIPVNARALFSIPDTTQLVLFDPTRACMDLSLVPSGLLEDIGVTPVDFAPFDGEELTNDNYVNFKILNGLLEGLSSSQIGVSTIPNDITTVMSNQFHTGVNPVGIVAYKYSRVKNYALAEHLLVEENGYYNDPPSGNNLESPYTDKYTIAFSPYMNIVGNNVTYYFSQSKLYTNLSIASILFDPGDGQFRPVTFGSGIIGDYSQVSGPVEIKLKIILDDNTTLYSHSRVSILSLPSFSPSAPANHYQTFESELVYEGYKPKARVTVKYANGSSFSKPLIFAEGFDPFTDPAHLMIADTAGVGFSRIERIIEVMDDAGLTDYDCVYVDWLNSRAPIEANADILKQIIDWVNISNPTGEKSVLIGESMGGLIARYALRTMEREGIQHNVKCYVSYDSPHYGVNIPLGYLFLAQRLFNILLVEDWQYFLDILCSVFDGLSQTPLMTLLSTYVTEFSGLQTAPSVKQMLINFIDSDYHLERDKYYQFQDTLQCLGFPQGDAGMGIRNLTVSNGGRNNFLDSMHPLLEATAMVKNGLVSEIFLWPFFALLDVNDFGHLGIGPGLSSLDIVFRVNPVKSGGEVAFESSAFHTKKTGIFQNQVYYYYNNGYNAPANPMVFDDDAGSYYELLDTIHKNKDWYHWSIGGYGIHLNYQNRFMFVPSVSALHYKNGLSSINSSERKKDFANDGLNIKDIPFDGYKFYGNNPSYHTWALRNDFKWIDRMQYLTIQPSPDTLMSGYQFHLNGLSFLSPDPYTVTWSVDDESVATITQINSSTAELTSSIGGTTEVYADIEYLGGHYRLKRQITVAEIPFPGFPSYVLYQNPDPLLIGGDFSGDYDVYARSSSQMDSRFTPYMQLHWGVQTNTSSPIQWTTRPYDFSHNISMIFECNFPSMATARRVYFYVTFRDYTSPTYSVFCRKPLPMIELDGDGNLYTEDMTDPFAQVKSIGGEEYYHFNCLGKSLVYDHWPTWAEYCTDMLTYEPFVNMIKTAKPWGTEDIVLIPFSYYTGSESDVENDYLTIRYDESL